MPVQDRGIRQNGEHIQLHRARGAIPVERGEGGLRHSEHKHNGEESGPGLRGSGVGQLQGARGATVAQLSVELHRDGEREHHLRDERVRREQHVADTRRGDTQVDVPRFQAHRQFETVHQVRGLREDVQLEDDESVREPERGRPVEDHLLQDQEHHTLAPRQRVLVPVERHRDHGQVGIPPVPERAHRLLHALRDDDQGGRGFDLVQGLLQRHVGQRSRRGRGGDDARRDCQDARRQQGRRRRRRWRRRRWRFLLLLLVLLQESRAERGHVEEIRDILPREHDHQLRIPRVEGLLRVQQLQRGGQPVLRVGQQPVHPQARGR